MEETKNIHIIAGGREKKETLGVLILERREIDATFIPVPNIPAQTQKAILGK